MRSAFNLSYWYCKFFRRKWTTTTTPRHSLTFCWLNFLSSHIYLLLIYYLYWKKTSIPMKVLKEFRLRNLVESTLNFLTNWANPGLILSIFVLLTSQIKYRLKMLSCCAWHGMEFEPWVADPLSSTAHQLWISFS